MNSQKNKKRVALITTWYPPVSGVAVNRMDSLSTYLSEDFEIEVFCLGDKKMTIQKSESLKVHYFKSNKLIGKLKSNQKDSNIIHNCKTILRILLKKIIKNPLNSWKNDVLNQIKNIHEINPFELIISSFSPEEAHLVAIEFCKLYPAIPWVADMRDEMSMNPTIDISTKLNLIKIEKLVNEFASAILSVSEPILNDFKLICPNVSYFEEVRNGYNHVLNNGKTKDLNHLVFTFGYFGSFYGATKPDLFFEALEVVLSSEKDFDFQVQIFGAHHNFTIPQKLKNKIVLNPGLSYEKAILKMMEIDVNVLLIPKNGRKGVYSGKLFDYISVQRPVLAMLDTQDVAAQLIEDFNCGYIAEFDKVDEIVDSIHQIIKDNKEGVLKFATKDQFESLHRKNQILKLKMLINKLISK